jgi:hypothetical protein
MTWIVTVFVCVFSGIDNRCLDSWGGGGMRNEAVDINIGSSSF